MKELFGLCLWCFCVFVVVVKCELKCENGTAADCTRERESSNVTVTTVIPPDTRPGDVSTGNSSTTPGSAATTASGTTVGSINSTTPGPTTFGVGRAINFNVGEAGIANTSITPEKGSLQDLSLDDIDEFTMTPSLEKDHNNFTMGVNSTASTVENVGISVLAANISTNGSCMENGVSYTIGQHFFKGCDAACTCELGGDIRCVPRCEGPFFRRGAKTDDPTCVEKLVDDPCCAILICSHDSEPEPLEECTYKNYTLKRGEVIKDNCDEVCTCGPSGKVSCKPRCPKPATNTSDRCVAVPDPNDVCCKKIFCDVTLTDHDSTKTDAVIPNLHLLETEVVNSTSIRLGLAGDPPENLTLESSIDQNTWRLHKVENLVVTGFEPGKTYYVRAVSGGIVSNTVEVIIPSMDMKESGVKVEQEESGGKVESDGSCQYKGRSYKMMEEFYEGCEAFCTCTQVGIHCATIECPTDFALDVVDPTCISWEHPPDFVPSPPRCCPDRVICKDNGSCIYSGERFDNWAEIPRRLTGCEQQCYCEFGNVTCQSTCPPVSETPPPDLQCPRSQAVLSHLPGDECCLHWLCQGQSKSNNTNVTSQTSTKPSKFDTSELYNGLESPTTMTRQKNDTAAVTKTQVVPFPWSANTERVPFQPTVIPVSNMHNMASHVPHFNNVTKPSIKDIMASHDIHTNKPTENATHVDHAVPDEEYFLGPLVVPHPEMGHWPPFINKGSKGPGKVSPMKTPPSHPKPDLPEHDHPVILYYPEQHGVVSPNSAAVYPLIPPGIPIPNASPGASPKPGHRIPVDSQDRRPPEGVLHIQSEEGNPPDEHLQEILSHLQQQGVIPPNYSIQHSLTPSKGRPDPEEALVERLQHQGLLPQHFHLPVRTDTRQPTAPRLPVAHSEEELILHLQQQGLLPSHVPVNVILNETHAGFPPEVPHVFGHRPGQQPDIIQVLTLEAVDEHTVRLVFSVPPVLVGLHGRVELRYTSDARNNDVRTWQQQILAPPDDLIATPQLEFELAGLEPDTLYKIQVTVMMRDIHNSPSSQILTVKTPPAYPQTTLPPTILVDPQLSVVEVNATWIHLIWKKFSDFEMQFIDGVQLRYKEIDDKIYSATPLIHRSVTNYTLEDLKPQTKYEVGIFFIPFPGQLTELQAKNTIHVTTAEEHDAYKFEIKLEVHNVKSTSVEITWNGVPYPEDKYVNIFRVIYQSDSGKEDFNTFKIAKRDSQAKTLIKDLKPGTRYRLWLEVYLTNGKIKKSNVQDITTKPGASGIAQKGKLERSPQPVTDPGDYYGPLVGVAIIAALAIVAALILLLILVRKYGQNKAAISASRKSQSAYDNPSYKVEIQQETMDL